MFFFFNDTATTEIYTLSLHDALPISQPAAVLQEADVGERRPVPHDEVGGAARLQDADLVALAHEPRVDLGRRAQRRRRARSEEHTAELQSRQYLVCRLLLGNKKKSQY